MMKSLTSLAAITALLQTISAQGQTLTGFGIGPVSGSTQFQNQTLFTQANNSPNFTKSTSFQASTTPAETWSWTVNVTSISNAAPQTQVINTVLSLTWPQQTTSNSVCAVAINGAPLTYTTNPGDDGNCAPVFQGGSCLTDLSASVSAGMISADGTAQCGTAFTNISLPESCSTYFTAGPAGLNVSASPMGNLQSGDAWLYSSNINSSSASALDDAAQRIWPVFLMRSAGNNVTAFADPKCLQAKASEKATATDGSSTPSATGDAAAATSTNAAPRAGVMAEAKGVAALAGAVVVLMGGLL